MGSTAHPQPLPIGAQIGVYEIKAILGISWFGTTYRAWNHHLQARVVVKEYLPQDLAMRAEDGMTVRVISPNQLTNYQYGLDRFLEEAEALAEFDHPSVVHLYTALPAHGTAYLAMEEVTGRTLASLSNGQKSGVVADNLGSIARQLLDALRQVHASGRVHGDVSPETILLRSNGVPVLIDFAQARLALAAHIDALPAVLRENYAAPEQYDPASQPGPWTDLYSLGATLYHSISGKPPTPAVARLAGLRSEAPDPQQSAVAKGGPVHLQRLLSNIDWMLSLDHRARPQSAAEILAAFPETAPAVDRKEQLEAQSASQPRNSALPATPHRSHQSTLVGGLVFLILVGIGLLLWTSRDAHRSIRTMAESRQTRTEITADATPSQQPKQPTLGARSAPASSDAESPAATSLTATAEAKAPTRAAEFAAAERPRLPVTVSSGPSAEPPASRETTPSRAAVPIAQQPPTGKPLQAKQPTAPSEHTLAPSDQLATPELAPVPASNTAHHPIIAHHLTAAAANLAALHLTTPPGDNAFEHYQAVLALVPHHPAAREGLQQIVERYSWLIGRAIEEGRLRRARIYLNRAQQVSPGAGNLKQLQQVLDEANRAE